MIVDFKSIGHDFYGKVEQPVLILKTPDGRIISTISNYYGLKPTFRFNDVSEVSFTVPAYFEDKENNGYKEISGMRLVEVEPYGDFVLINPEKNNEGGKKEVKVCKAYSLEYTFNYKKADIPAGTYNFYNPVDNSNTILQMIIELMPDWSIGEIDSRLIGRWRTFDNVDDSLYAFMMNTLQESYNCLFLFDTFNKRINVKEANRSAYNLPIYLSYDNLLKSVKVTELSEDIVTALSGYGSGDDVNIRSVNPNGTNTIYNLDYFISKGDLPDELADKWVQYDDSLELYQQIFSNFKVLRLQKNNEKELAKAKLSVIETDRDAFKTAYLTAQTNNGQQPEYDIEIQNLKDKWDAKEAEIIEQKNYIESIEDEITQIESEISEIVSACSINSYFTEDEVKILSQYFIQDSIADDTFVIPEYSSAILQSNSNALSVENNGSIKIVGSEVYASNIAQIFTADENGVYQPYVIDEENGEYTYNGSNNDLFNGIEIPTNVAETVATQLNNNAKQKIYEFRGGIFEFNYITRDNDGGTEAVRLKGDVVNVNFHYNTDNLPSYNDENSSDLTKVGHFTLTATLRNAIYRDTSYPSMNFSIQGMLLNDVPQVSDEFITMNIESAIIYTTASNTDFQKQAILQELYDYVEDSLEKLAFPSYEFSVDSANFIFAKKFEPFKDKLELGSTINLLLDDDEDQLLQPILIEVVLNYDDESDFQITFSNKYRSSSSEFQLADLITEMNRQTKSTTRNKGNYQAYKDSKAGDQVDNLTNSAIDVVKNKVVNSNNQAIEWDSTGMFFRKTLPNGGFDPKQIGIINEDIAFTKDGWQSVEIAIGAYEDPNLGEGYGIIAPSIFGTLVAGKNLQFQNENKQFIFDETGAWLYNSSLAFVQDENVDTGYPGGKLIIDPRYGIVAGNKDLFSLVDTDEGIKVIPTFWDEENSEIIWDENEVVEAEDGSGSTYYVPLNSQFYFDVNTGNAYFSGTINGKKIVPDTVSGDVIINGTVDAGSKLTGSVATEQLAPNIVSALNKYVEITEGDNREQIDVNLIGNLSAKNFIGEKIIADEVAAENIKGDIIAAGSLISEKLIVNGDDAKLAITPEYGIVAGNSSLFETDEDGNIINPTFIDSDGKIIIDENTGAPVNSSFYFDINTGQAYFTGPLSAKQIVAGKLSSDYLDVKDAFITNAMIENLSADKINAGNIAADIMQANVIAAINAQFGEAKINTATIDQLTADQAWVNGLLTAGEILTDKAHVDTVNVTGYLSGVQIFGDLIQANTLKADRLILKGSDGIYRALNVDALGEDAFNDIVDNTPEGQVPTVYEGIDGSVIIAKSITATEVDVNSLFAQEITAVGTISGGTFLQKRNGFKASDGSYYTTGTYIGDEGIAFGDALIYDSKEDHLTIKADDIDLIGKVTFADFKTSEDGSTGFVNHDGTTVITGNHILTGSLGVGVNLNDYVSSTTNDITEINNNLYGVTGDILLDEDGNPVYKLDENGNKIKQKVLDENGNPVYALDEYGNKIPLKDEDGNIIYDEDGVTPLYEYEYATKQVLDEDGNPVYALDENGEKIPLRDTEGNIIYDEDGVTPLYEYEYELVYEYEYESYGILTTLDNLDNDYEKFGELINDLSKQLDGIYTKEEIQDYFNLILSNSAGGISSFGSLLKYINADPLKGLVINGFDVIDGEFEESPVYEYVYVEEIGQSAYRPVMIEKVDDNGNVVYDEDGKIVYVEKTELKPKLSPSPYSVVINNAAFKIMNGETPVTTIFDNTMEIDKAEIKTDLRLGNYVFDLTESTLNLFYDPKEPSAETLAF